MKIFKVKENCSLKKFTSSVYPQGAFAFSRLLSDRDIRVNGKRVDGDVALCAGDDVAYYTSAKEEAKPSHTIIYSDENVEVIDKFDGVSVEGLTSELSASSPRYPAHRLDTNTRGLIIFAKNDAARGELEFAFRERLVKKQYLAVCLNNFKKSSATLSAYLKKNSGAGTVAVFDKPVYGGSRIITEYEILEDRGKTALVLVTLRTGKTHQIRAHLAHIGCPVLGDGKYGARAFNKEFSAARQRLLSYTLSFTGLNMLGYLNGVVFKSRLSVE